MDRAINNICLNNWRQSVNGPFPSFFKEGNAFRFDLFFLICVSHDPQ